MQDVDADARERKSSDKDSVVKSDTKNFMGMTAHIKRCKCGEKIVKPTVLPTAQSRAKTCKCCPRCEPKLPTTAVACTNGGPEVERHSFKQQTNDGKVNPLLCSCDLVSTVSLPVINQPVSGQTEPKENITGKPNLTVRGSHQKAGDQVSQSQSTPDINSLILTECICSDKTNEKASSPEPPPPSPPSSNAPVNGSTKVLGETCCKCHQRPECLCSEVEEEPSLPKMCLCEQINMGLFCVPGSPNINEDKNKVADKECGPTALEEEQSDQCSITPTITYLTQPANTESRPTQKDVSIVNNNDQPKLLPSAWETAYETVPSAIDYPWGILMKSWEYDLKNFISDCFSSTGRFRGLRGGMPDCTCPPGQCKEGCTKKEEEKKCICTPECRRKCTEGGAGTADAAAAGGRASTGSAPRASTGSAARASTGSAAAAAVAAAPPAAAAAAPRASTGSAARASTGSAPRASIGSAGAAAPAPAAEVPVSSCTCPDDTPCKPKCQERKDAARKAAELAARLPCQCPDAYCHPACQVPGNDTNCEEANKNCICPPTDCDEPPAPVCICAESPPVPCEPCADSDDQCARKTAVCETYEIGCLSDPSRDCAEQGCANDPTRDCVEDEDDGKTCTCSDMKCVKSACELKKNAVPEPVIVEPPPSVIPANTENLTDDALKCILKNAPPSQCKCVGPCNTQCERIKRLRCEIMSAGRNSVIGSNANPMDTSTQVDKKSNCTCSTVDCKRRERS